ncbi:uncharacterized protein LOC111083698, partial [Limulus polyphemus]|uniref:Uncharacterized protein LOC111083698 n=1 Tax=Limulus polyphemus TaxID=6850 RepID=A0ABM1RXE9_LIMPO
MYLNIKHATGDLKLEASSVETSSDDTRFDDGSNGSTSRSASSSSINGETNETTAEHLQEIGSRECEKYQESKLHLTTSTKTASNQEDKSDGDECFEPLNLKAKQEYSSVINTVCLSSEPSPESDTESASAPLDLCIKKHESSAVTTQIEDTSLRSNTTFSLSFGHHPLVSSQPATAGVLLMPGTRRRGRKPRNWVAQDGQLKQPPKSSSIIVSASNQKMSFQSSTYSPSKSSKSASLDIEKLMSYMLSHIPPSRGRPRGRPRGRGRGRGRGRLPLGNYLPVNGDSIPRNQKHDNLPSGNLPVV